MRLQQVVRLELRVRVSAGELSRVFRKNLGVYFVTGAFQVYRNALTFALPSYWGEDLAMAADFTLEPAA